MEAQKFNRLRAYLNNLFWLFLTYLLAPLFYSLVFLKRKQKSEKLKILVIQTAKIGDMVCTTPVFREIKRKFPSCYLTVLITAKTKDILKNNPRVDEVVLLDNYSKIGLLSKLRKEKYDWALNLLPGSFNNIISFWSLVPHRVTTTHKGVGEIMGLLSIFNNYCLEYKSRILVVRHYLNLLRFIGIEGASEEKEIFIQPEEEKKALDFLSKSHLNGNDLLIGISPVPGNRFKQWKLAKFANLADQLVEKLNAKIIFTGSANDKTQVEKVQKMMQNDSINSSGYFKLHELPALLKKLKLFISVDSGPLYVANTVGTPVIDIGGSYDIQEQAPSGNRCKILQKFPVSCSFITPLSGTCKEKYLKCLRETVPGEVLDAAISLINTNSS